MKLGQLKQSAAYSEKYNVYNVYNAMSGVDHLLLNSALVVTHCIN